MNQSRMWLVVKPTLGIPVFLGGVALIAFTVHFAILKHSSWFQGFLAGS